MHSYIVYYVQYEGTVVYIGSGLVGREKHTTSGVSHVYGLNKLHFTCPHLVSVHILKGFSSKGEALKEEKELILEFRPLYNNQYLEDSSDRYSKSSSLLIKRISRISHAPTIPDTKNIKIICKLLKKYSNYSEKFGTESKSLLKCIEEGLELHYKEIILQIAGYHSFQKAMEVYCELIENKTELELIKLIEKTLPDFKEYYEVLGSTRIKSLGYSETRLFRALDKIQDEGKSSKIIPVISEGFYSKKELKEIIQEFYNKNDLNLKAKASDVTKWYKARVTTKNKINGFLIEGKV